MNNANCSTPACQDRPDRPHQRRNNAIECAYAFVVDSAASRPNRRCRRYSSATPTTCRSSSSTVQYRCPDGKLTGNARMVSRFLVDSHKRLPATSTTPPEKRRSTGPATRVGQRPATGQETTEKACGAAKPGGWILLICGIIRKSPRSGGTAACSSAGANPRGGASPSDARC